MIREGHDPVPVDAWFHGHHLFRVIDNAGSPVETIDRLPILLPDWQFLRLNIETP
jgi:hypothetical protein